MTSPGVELLREALKLWIDDIAYQWESGRFAGTGNLYKDSLANAQALGQIDLLRKLVRLDYDDFSGIFSEKYERAAS